MKKNPTIIAQWGKTCPNRSEEILLNQHEPRFSDVFRIIKITIELIISFFKFRHLKAGVTIFGSARIDQHHPHYKMVMEMGQLLGQNNYTVLTGGGPGLMEAANKGAKSVGGKSIGLNIKLPYEQKANPYLDDFFEYNYFFTRKLVLAKYSYAFIAAPGGFGTLDELFEIITLIQTQKMKNFPVILLGQKYWEPLMSFIYQTMLKAGTIDQSDLDIIFLTDSPQDALSFIKRVLNN
jgi:uncharacterized protein (TIGR00730 family)